MKLIILSPWSEKKYDVRQIEVFTTEGSFTILDHHTATLLVLAPGKPFEFIPTQSKSTESLLLPHGGILKITRESATLLMH